MRRAHGHQDRVFEWREIAAFAELELLLEIPCEIMVAGKLNRGTKRRVSLHENFSLGFAATGPTRHLSKQLESPFARAEIGKMQRQIRVNDSDQRHVRKMQTFGNHLRPNQDVDLSGAEIP